MFMNSEAINTVRDTKSSHLSVNCLKSNPAWKYEKIFRQSSKDLWQKKCVEETELYTFMYPDFDMI